MLWKSTLREIRTSLARYLAIFAIVALGVGFFSGLKDCKASMISTADRYVNDHNFYDFMILSSYGIDDESIVLAAKERGVTGAEGSIQIDAMVGTGASFTITSWTHPLLTLITRSAMGVMALLCVMIITVDPCTLA